MKSTLNVEDLVKIKGMTGLYTIMSVEAGNNDCTYQVCPKTQYDNWIGEDPDTFPKKVFNIDCKQVVKFG